MQDELFPELVQSHEQMPPQSLQGKFPVLKVFEEHGMVLDDFENHGLYVRVRLNEQGVLFQPDDFSSEFSSKFTDEYADEAQNSINWYMNSLFDARRNPIQEGFVQTITTLRETGAPIIHMLWHIDDVHTFSFAVLASDIEELAIYSENAMNVRIMADNAEVDGNTIDYCRMRGYKVAFTDEQMTKIIEDFWPEPEVVFVKSES